MSENNDRKPIDAATPDDDDDHRADANPTPAASQELPADLQRLIREKVAELMAARDSVASGASPESSATVNTALERKATRNQPVSRGKKYQCDVCHKYYVGPKMLAKHERTAHPRTEESSSEETSTDSEASKVQKVCRNQISNFQNVLFLIPKTVRALLKREAVESDSDGPQHSRARKARKRTRRSSSKDQLPAKGSKKKHSRRHRRRHARHHQRPEESDSDSPSERRIAKPQSPDMGNTNLCSRSVQTSPSLLAERDTAIITYTPGPTPGEIGIINELHQLPSDTEPGEHARAPRDDGEYESPDDDQQVAGGEQQQQVGYDGDLEEYLSHFPSLIQDHTTKYKRSLERVVRNRENLLTIADLERDLRKLLDDLEGQSDTGEEEEVDTADDSAEVEEVQTYSRKVCIGRGQQRWKDLTLVQSFYVSLSMALKCLELGCPLRFVRNIKRAAEKCQQEIETMLGHTPCLQNADGCADDEDFRQIRMFYKLGIMMWSEKRKLLVCKANTPNCDWPKIHLLLYNEENTQKVCLIQNFSQFRHSFECPACHRDFTHRWTMDRHLRNNCEFVRWQELNPALNENQFWHETEDIVYDLQYTPGKFKSPVPLVEALQQLGVTVTSDLLPLNPWVGFYDIEAALFPMEKESDANALELIHHTTYTKKQVPVCIAMSSNVMGFTKPVCFVSFSEYSDFLKNFIQYSYDVADKCYALNRERLEPILDQLDDMEQSARANGNIPFEKQVKSAIKRLIQHISRLTMLSYNGSRYDVPVLLRYSGMVYYLWQMDKIAPKAIKRAANTFVSLSSRKLVFKDICNYFSGGCSLRDFLREMKCEVGKLHFSYSSICSYESLHRKHPPNYSEFFSDLKHANTLEMDYDNYQQLLANGMTEQQAMSQLKLSAPPLKGRQEYQKVLDLWAQQGFTAMFQWLALYCIFDTISAVEASVKLRDYFFRVTKLDAFQFSTINSLAFTHLTRQLAETMDPRVSFFARLDKPAASIVSAAKCGGICHAYDRIAVAGLTRIKPHQYGPQAELCDKIVGLDLVAMYPSSIKLFLTSTAGYYTLRTHDDDFESKNVMGKSRKALSALRYYSEFKINRPARSILSPEGERALYVGRPGTSKCRVFLDGWWKNPDDDMGIAFSFHGSIWHGYVDGAGADDINPVNGRRYADLRAETEQQDTLITEHPLVTQHIIMKESDYDERFRTDAEFRCICQQYVKGITPPVIKERMSQSEIQDALLSGKIVGLVEVDMSIRRPEDYIKFSNFPPFVKKAKLASSDVLNPEIRAELEANNKLSRPQEMLISTMDGSHVTIPSQLLQYYVHELDLSLDYVWKVLQFRQSKCFDSWYSNLISMRAKARAEGNESMGRTIKSVMNSSYGYPLLKVENRTSTSFVKEERIDHYLDRPTFHTLYNAGPPSNCEGIYEVVLRQTRPKLTLPRQIAVEILGTSKILNLRFVYKFLWKYFRPSSWSLLFSDTDSFGLQVSCGGDWLKMKRPEFTDAEIEAAVLEFIVPTDGSDLAKRLATEAGYIKEEKTGTVAIALAPKTYYLCNDVTGAHSIACKGIPKTKENEQIFTYLAFHNCLFGSLNSSAKATVRGIRTAPNDTSGPMSFVQMKNGLSNVSVKFEYCRCKTHFMIREIVADPTLRKLVYPYFEECDTDPELILKTVMARLTDRNRRALKGPQTEEQNDLSEPPAAD